MKFFSFVVDVAEARECSRCRRQALAALCRSCASGTDRDDAVAHVELIVQIMPEHAAGVRDLRIQQNARAFETRCADDDRARFGVQFAARLAVDEDARR